MDVSQQLGLLLAWSKGTVTDDKFKDVSFFSKRVARKTRQLPKHPSGGYQTQFPLGAGSLSDAMATWGGVVLSPFEMRVWGIPHDIDRRKVLGAGCLFFIHILLMLSCFFWGLFGCQSKSINCIQHTGGWEGCLRQLGRGSEALGILFRISSGKQKKHRAIWPSLTGQIAEPFSFNC